MCQAAGEGMLMSASNSIVLGIVLEMAHTLVKLLGVLLLLTSAGVELCHSLLRKERTV